MEKGQTKTRVEELLFCLYHRAIHPELFDIRRVKRLNLARYQAEIWVCELAHVITVKAGKQVVTELIAGENGLLPKAGLVTSFRFRGERDHSQDFDDGFKYILSTQVERLTPPLFPATHRDYVHYAQNRGIYLQFDEKTIDGLAPFSFVDFDARDHELHIHAFHAFPEEQTLLKTQSIFEIGKPTISPV
ncbi:MAG: DUF2617 family protein [Planctomycetes bacterium]|nr:DUF2617 family protein [Planctomycetota bacterium]MBI3833346.1 DUF2617 family protein [Planctomycetota bacterium]